MPEILPEALCFDDIFLVPRHSDISSRDEVDLSVSLPKGVALGLPIISAPMDTVTNGWMAYTIGAHGALGIIHRYYPLDRQMLELSSDSSTRIGIAISTKGDWWERVLAATKRCSIPPVVCIDTAHGHHDAVKVATKALRDWFGDSIHIMAGNIADGDAYNFLADAGVDSVRVGVSSGGCCLTAVRTGHGMPTLQAVINCNRAREVRISEGENRPAIIADGGIRHSGDIVKALAFGADAVMCGSLFAGTDEAPGESVDGYKALRGMASKQAKLEWNGEAQYIEGIDTKVSIKGPVGNILRELSDGIRSGLSYSGARNILELRSKVVARRYTASSCIEGGPHAQRDWI